MKKFFYLCLSILLFVQSGCKDTDLSREEASKLLETTYPQLKTINVRMHSHDFGNGYHQASNEIEKLSDLGILSYSLIPAGTPGYGMDATLTDEGEKYLANEQGSNGEYLTLISAQIGLGEIISIRQIPANNTAEVEYTEKIIQVTPVGGAVDNVILNQATQKTALFVKTDTGWQKSQ